MFSNIGIHMWMEKHQGPSPSDRYPRLFPPRIAQQWDLDMHILVY